MKTFSKLKKKKEEIKCDRKTNIELRSLCTIFKTQSSLKYTT